MSSAISSVLKGSVKAPPSKSVSQRALACAFLAEGTTVLTNFGYSDDEKAALAILGQLGCRIETTQDTLKITPPKQLKDKITINCGESGLCARLFIPILMSFDIETTIEGEGTLLDRPMTSFQQVFKQLEIAHKWKDEKLPLKIKGRKTEKTVVVDGSLSSQFVTGMIFYVLLSSKLKEGELRIENLKSIPYVELTVDVLKKFGVEMSFSSKNITIPAAQTIKPTKLDIEGDWSGASNFLVAAALMGDIEVSNLNLNSKQADIKILEALTSCGAKIERKENSIRVREFEKHPFDFDATHCPDLFPILTVLACFTTGTSSIKGVHRLKHKESDRAMALINELKKLDVELNVIEDKLIIISPINWTHLYDKKQTFTLETYNDHRLVMAFSILALKLNILMQIKNLNSVNKSYPGFFNDLRTILNKK